MNKKIISFILVFIFSAALWVSVTLSNYYFTTIEIPLKVVNVPQGYAAYTNNPKEVQLKLKGEGWRLAYLTLSDNIQYSVSANNDSGRIVFNLPESVGENQWLSTGIQVFNINPEKVPFRIEKLFYKKIKVIPDLKLSFIDDFGLSAPVRIDPDSIIISAPMSILKLTDSVPTERIEIKNINKSLSRKVLFIRNTKINYSQNYGLLYLTVERIVDKKFERIPVEVRNIPNGYSVNLFPDNLNIVLRGGINTLGKMKNSDLFPYVNFEKIYKDTTGTIEPNLDIPPYTELISKEPNYLKYIIKKF